LILRLSDWSVRTATPEDIPAVLGLWRASGGPVSVTDHPGGLAALLARDPHALLVADHDGVPIGSLIAVWDGWRGNFYKLVVHPRRRRAGIASALVSAAEQRLRSRGATRVAAVVDGGDPVALAFWRSAGYELQGERARFVRHLPA
jgi:ribosomal protein S18 acetylase RimI-like enzyme